MNVLIVGARGAGKTTLIRRVLESLDRPVRTFLQGCSGAPWGEGSGDRSSEGQGYGLFKQRPLPSWLPVFFHHGRKQGCAV